jgi:hypothetical protein
MKKHILVLLILSFFLLSVGCDDPDVDEELNTDPSSKSIYEDGYREGYKDAVEAIEGDNGYYIELDNDIVDVLGEAYADYGTDPDMLSDIVPDIIRDRIHVNVRYHEPDESEIDYLYD